MVDGRPPGVLCHGGLCGALAAVQPPSDNAALSTAPSPPRGVSEVAGALAWSSRKSISRRYSADLRGKSGARLREFEVVT